jgi:AAA domain-containing protein
MTSRRAIEAGIEAERRASPTPAQLQAERDAKEQAVAKRIVRRRRAVQAVEEHQKFLDGVERQKGLAELYEARTAREFLASAPQHEWLVEGLFIDGQPALLGGPKKTYKTSIAVDLALSIASGTPFLGTFRVPKPRPVVLASGESGAATLAETIRRVVSARGLSDAVLDNVQILTALPNFSDESSIYALMDSVNSENPVWIIDPLYRCFGQGEINTADLVRMGSLLTGFIAHMREFTGKSICVDADGNEVSHDAPGAELQTRYQPSTVILVHHAKKNTWGRRALEMDDLAFAGVSEFTRQWFLVNWRASFRPAEPKRLIVAYGGSAGHSGQFALTIDEGQLAADFTGRTWKTTVQSIEEARQADKQQRERDKRDGAANRRIAALLDLLPEDGSRVSYSQAKQAMGCNPKAADRAIDAAVAAGLIGHEQIGKRRFVWRLAAEQAGGVACRVPATSEKASGGGSSNTNH